MGLISNEVNMKISEVIVVEGKNDVARVRLAVDAFVVSVSGQGITKNKIKFLKELNKTRGIIVLMDPDSPGEKIRAIIAEQIPTAKHAFITKRKALLDGDIGIENASIESIKESLKTLITPHDEVNHLMVDDLIKYKLVSTKDSTILRDKLSTCLNLGKCNGKTLLKRLNMLNITKEELKTIMEKINEQ